MEIEVRAAALDVSRRTAGRRDGTVIEFYTVSVGDWTRAITATGPPLPAWVCLTVREALSAT